MLRENTLTMSEAGLLIPDHLRRQPGMGGGSRITEAEIVDKLNHGDPALGWEGDPRLALYQEGDVWVLYRLEADGELRPVMRSKPGLPLDERIIIRLVEQDQRRGFDPVAWLEGNAG